MRRFSLLGIAALAALAAGSVCLSRATAQLSIPPDTVTILRVPWLVTDSIAFAAVGLSIFGAEGGNEVRNANLLLDLIDRFGGDETAAKGIFDDLFWIDDPDAPTTIKGRTVTYPNQVRRFSDPQMALLHDGQVKAAIRKAAAFQHDEQALADEVARRLGMGGLFSANGHSNALVVGKAHTSTGHPMLGGGPQVGYQTPSFFWESGLHTPTYDSVGVNVPLGPGNIMGRTETLAYTVTSGIDDQIDTYVERLNPANVRQYGEAGHWLDMDCRTETFLVRLNPSSLPDTSSERMNRGSWNQLHDFGAGGAFLTFGVVPPGESGMIDLQTLVASQAADDAKQAIDDGNPHVFDQKPLYESWTFKRFVQHQDDPDLAGATEEVIPYVRGVISPDTALPRYLWTKLDQAGIPLPSFTIFGEVATR